MGVWQGGPGRWTLADDSRGLDSMAAMYAIVNTTASQITLFTTLQGLTLLLLILRLISFLSAQKRLSILTTTAVKVCGRACMHMIGVYVHACMQTCVSPPARNYTQQA